MMSHQLRFAAPVHSSEVIGPICFDELGMSSYRGGWTYSKGREFFYVYADRNDSKEPGEHLFTVTNNGNGTLTIEDGALQISNEMIQRIRQPADRLVQMLLAEQARNRESAIKYGFWWELDNLKSPYEV